MSSLTAAEALLREGVAARAFPGAVYAVVHRGATTTGAIGRFTYDADSPSVAPDTIYDLASLTKVVATAMMAMLLVERGRLELEAPVIRFVPEFTSSGDARREDVTVAMLLQHTSGLPAYSRLYELARGKQAVIEAACRIPLEAPPETRQLYSDIGFIILGELLERASGEPVNEFFDREISGPLSMSSTCFCPSPSLRLQIPPTENDQRWRHRIIQGQVNDENASAMGGIAGHAGLFSSAPDLACFANRMLLGTPPVGAELFCTFTSRDWPTPSYQLGSFALGWDTPSSPSQSGQYFSSSSFGHLGFTGTSLWIDPEQDLAVVLLTNRTWPDRQSQLIKQFRPRFHDAVVEAL